MTTVSCTRPESWVFLVVDLTIAAGPPAPATRRCLDRAGPVRAA
jgi:hypothetical protein